MGDLIIGIVRIPLSTIVSITTETYIKHVLFTCISDYNIKQINKTDQIYITWFKDSIYMGRSPNYGRNSNILISDPYH